MSEDHQRKSKPSLRSRKPTDGRTPPTTDFSAKFNATVEYTANGVKHRASPFEIGLLSEVNRAVTKGHMPSARAFLSKCEVAGLITVPVFTEDHQSVLRIPDDWDEREWMQLYIHCGPPPWPGPRDGMVSNPPRKDFDRIGKRATPEPVKATNQRLPGQYDVGYKRPPIHSRWRPGQSGNKRGPPKRAGNFRSIVLAIAFRKTTLIRNGKRLRSTNLEHVIDAVRFRAARGDPTAMQLIIRYGIPQPDKGAFERRKGVLIVGEKLTQVEWEKKYGHLGNPLGSRDHGDGS